MYIALSCRAPTRNCLGFALFFRLRRLLMMMMLSQFWTAGNTTHTNCDRYNAYPAGGIDVFVQLVLRNECQRNVADRSRERNTRQVSAGKRGQIAIEHR